MSSITSCVARLKKAGTPVSAEDKRAIMALIRSGVSAKDAVRAQIHALENPGAPAQATAAPANKPRVFKSRKAAEAERDALGNGHKLQPIKGGFILRAKTDAEMAAEARNGKRLRAGASGKRSLLTVIAAGGGLNIKDRADTIGEGNRNVGGKMLFTREGKSIHQWAEELHEGGWMPVDESEAVGWLQQAISDEYAGRAEHFQLSDDESLAKQVEAARGEEPDPLVSFDVDELQDSGYAAASPDVQALTEAILAEAEALGIDSEAIKEDAARATEGLSDDEYHAQAQRIVREAITAARQVAAPSDTGAAGRGGEDRGQAAGDQGQEGLTPAGDDWLAELFGTPAEQAKAQARFEADAAAKKQDMARIRDAIAEQKARAIAEHDDWAGRVYRANKTQVELRGDGPSKHGSMSIGAINESRRRNAMESLAQELKALDKLTDAVSTDSGAERVLANLRALRQKAESAVASGNWPGMGADEMFESMLLEDMKFRGPGGKGNTTSNGMSRAMLAAVKPTEAQGLTLEAQDAESLRAKAKREADAEAADKAEQKRLEAKARADAQVGDFTLTGSNRAADVGAAQGQGDIFAAAAPAPLYASRPVTNAEDIRAWAARQGFKSTLPAEDMHVTVAYSKSPISGSAVPSDSPSIAVNGGKRSVEPLGYDGAVVLKFASDEMQARWKQYRDAGASWDYESYTPHVTLTYDGNGVDLSKVTPYAGPINLGAEKQEALNEDKKDEYVEEPVSPAAETASQAEPSPIDQRIAEAEKAGSKPSRGKIEDFGEKLEGARKDYATLLKDAQDVDVAAEPLSKSWPEPDYDKLLAAGGDPYMVAFIHAARDEIPTKPQRSWKLRGWVDGVKSLREMSRKFMSGEIDKQTMQTVLAKPEFSGVAKSVGSRAELYELVGHGHSLKGISFAENHYSLYRGQQNVRKWAVEQKAKATAFSNWPRELAVADTKAEMLEQFKAKIGSLDTGTKAKRQPQFVIYRQRGKDGYTIGKKIGREYIDLHQAPDVASARAYMAEYLADLEAKLEKYQTLPLERNPENQPRVGDDHRNGAPVTKEVFEQTFGFRGVQFGNYVEQSRRQSDLNEGYDALMDMAAVLGIPPRSLSLNGKLGLAFGARGKGGKNAPGAHYEPDRVVINLTKGGGPGALAHEWWHSLDNYFGSTGRVPAYGTGAGPAADTREQMKAAFTAVKAATQMASLRQRSQRVDQRKPSTARKPYWNTPIELSARSFESYIVAKLKDQNAANDYLANIVSKEFWDADESIRADFFGNGKAEETYPYPTADEAPAIRAAFDNFFKVVETRSDDAGNVALYEPDAPAYTGGAYETDLFGTPLPAATRANRRAGPDRAGLRGDAQPEPAVPADTAAPPGDYYAPTVVGVVHQRKLGSAKITTPQEAAQATRYLYESAVERLDGIVTDKNGKPLAVVGGFKGALSQASVYPATIMGEAIRVPGAAHIWFSHNHPSGTAVLSRADEFLNQTLSEVFRGSGIEPMGLLAIGGDEFGFVGPRLSDQAWGTSTIQPSQSSITVPTIERLATRPAQKKAMIESPAQAKAAAGAYYTASGGPGLMLLDAQHGISAWVPISPEMRGALRGTGGLNAIYRAVSEANAGAAIIVHGGELGQQVGPGVMAPQNIAAALTKLDVRALDIINAKTGESVAERGGTIAEGPVYSRAKAAGRSDPAALRSALEAELGADTVAALEQAGLLTINDLPPSNMPSDVAGVTQNGRIGLYAANTAPGSVAVALHEALHATLRATIGDAAFDALMARMPALVAGNSKFFSDARIPADTPAAALNGERASYSVEAYQRNREAMPNGVRRWVEDLFAALKAGLAKALQAAGVGLKIRVRLMSDAAVLRVLARDGLKAMAREQMGAQLQPAYSRGDDDGFWYRIGKRGGVDRPSAARVADILLAKTKRRRGAYAGDQPGRSGTGLDPIRFRDRIGGWSDFVSLAFDQGGDGKDGITMFVVPSKLVQRAVATERDFDWYQRNFVLRYELIGSRDGGVEPSISAPSPGMPSFDGAEEGAFTPTGQMDRFGQEHYRANLGFAASKDYLSEALRRFALHAGYTPRIVYSRETGASVRDESRGVSADVVEAKFSRAPQTDTKAPRLKEDIPNDHWLREQVEYAEHKGRNRWGVPFMGNITGSFSDLVPVRVDVLAKLSGQRNEQTNVRPASLEHIRAHWNDMHAPYIEVAYNGEAWVSEGNHRIMVAAERGMEMLPVEIRYFDGGQRADGPLKPDALGNRGTFDPTSLDIRYSRMGQAIRNAGGGPQIVGQTSRQYTPAQKAAMRNVGFEVDKPSLEDRAKALWRDAGKKLAQGIADQFAPVKDLSREAYALMRLSKGASGAFETMLQGGKLKLTDGVYDFDETDKGGVVDSLLIPLQGEHHDFFRWVAAHRAERLTAEGREHLFTPADITALKTLADGQMAADYTIQTGPRAGQTTRDRTIVYADARRTLTAFNKNVLDMAEQSGLIDAESRKVWEHDFYVPFYRVADDGGIAGVNVKSGAVRQEAFKTLKGGKQALNADLLDNTLMNWSHLLDAAAKNRGAKATLEAAVNAGIAVESTESAVREMSKAIQQKNGVVWVMDGGKKRFFLVGDPYVLSAITALEYAGMRNPVMNAMGAMKHALTVGVTASPFFKIRNLIRDSVQAIGTSDLGYNPAANVAQGWKLTDPKSDEYFRLLAGGGTIHFGTMMEGSEAKRVQALVESGVGKATILDSEHKVKAFYRQYIEPAITAYNELGNRGEAVNRASLYDQLRRQGVSHAEASLQARDLMDFSMQGTFTSIRFLTQVVPFFNARIQGMYKLGRATKENPAKIGVVLGATTLASLSLLLAFGDDEDWKKREDWDRNTYWWFKFGGTAFRIPKPFEIGAIATLAERGFELAFDKEMTGTRFREQVLTLLGDNLAMNPVPQLVKPMLDVYANKNSFTGRPIETLGMERLAPQYRFNDSTSMAARGVSSAMNAATGLVGAEALSPVQVDAMLRGYFGWLGSFVVGAADALARPATGQASRPSIDIWKMATGGMVSDLRDAPSRYVSEVYKQARDMEQAYGTWKMLVAEGKGEEAREFYADNREDIAGYKAIERIKREQSQLNQRIRAVERGEQEPDAKRAQIRALQAMRDRAARQLQPG